MAKLQRKIHCLGIQITILAIEIRIRDCKTTARAVLRSVISAVRQGSSCNNQNQRAHSPTEKVALLHEQIHPSKRYVVQEAKSIEAKRCKLAQLARKQDHYATLLLTTEEVRNHTRNEIARYRATGSRPKSMPSKTGRAGSALLQSSIRNCMSPSEIIVLYEDEVEKARGMGGHLDRRRVCKDDCGECRKYRMDRCWWCP
ncbi:hypothetical protein EG328_003681 [Venturia inaequalis]|uniref:Uncharacterized protein n=1 Tax=Venturia inaequalis TaxID=5025 RepID=A0A8H3YV45_VENIN|nr:hypothetical protein EG328_003681 [Venturia inaequalis]KAE9994205.1 hypothetical protein EG327_000487 [Venturia inaequalis]